MKRIFVKILSILLISFAVLPFVSCDGELHGKFYSLRQAYDEKLLTVDDIRDIAYYCDHDYPEKLNDDIDLAIRTDFYTQIVKINSLEAISLRRYFGCYNDCYVIYVYDYNNMDQWMIGGGNAKLTIADIELVYPNIEYIFVWKKI